MTHLWKYTDEAEASLEMTDFWVPKRQRMNDQFLMVILLPYIPNKNMHYKINDCRVALNVIFLSDITTLDGRNLLQKVYKRGKIIEKT